MLEYDGSSGAILCWYAYALWPNDVLNQMNVTAGTRAALVPDILGSIIASQDSSSGSLPDGQNSWAAILRDFVSRRRRRGLRRP